MYQRKIKRDIRCPLEYGLSVFGGKWKARIICLLSDGTPKRYSALMKELGNITDAVLSARLRELTADGIVCRMAYPEVPPRVEYGLTDHGRSVLPILASIAHWAGARRRDAEENAVRCEHCDYTTP